MLYSRKQGWLLGIVQCLIKVKKLKLCSRNFQARYMFFTTLPISSFPHYIICTQEEVLLKSKSIKYFRESMVIIIVFQCVLHVSLPLVIINLILLLLFLYWGYIVTFTKVLAVYYSLIRCLHYSPFFFVLIFHYVIFLFFPFISFIVGLGIHCGIYKRS
jgi:hypothetical protein